ncbi:MAG: proton-conducting transporter membrane subunit [Acidobacteriota bacterium]
MNSIATVPLFIVALIGLLTWRLSPKSDTRLVVLGAAMAYLANTPVLFWLGWTLTTLPLLKGQAKAPKLVLLASTGLLGAGFLMAAWGPSPWAFGLIAAAALLRKGIFPFHFWIPMAFETADLGVVNLMLNSHLGAFALLRFGVPLAPEVARQAIGFLAVLALFTAVYTALLATVAKRPRRILALLCTSQASFILAGIENRNLEGITGALIHWVVVSLTTSSLVLVYQALENRTKEVTEPAGYLGFGYHAPRLAVFFAINMLALVGLPGTLGFAAEDLLFHGSLESHPLLGIGLPLATALNAITGYRLMTKLFLGRRSQATPVIPDALPQERWALVAPALILVAGGLFPNVVVALREPAAESILSVLGSR